MIVLHPEIALIIDNIHQKPESSLTHSSIFFQNAFATFQKHRNTMFNRQTIDGAYIKKNDTTFYSSWLTVEKDVRSSVQTFTYNAKWPVQLSTVNITIPIPNTAAILFYSEHIDIHKFTLDKADDLILIHVSSKNNEYHVQIANNYKTNPLDFCTITETRTKTTAKFNIGEIQELSNEVSDQIGEENIKEAATRQRNKLGIVKKKLIPYQHLHPVYYSPILVCIDTLIILLISYVIIILIKWASLRILPRIINKFTSQGQCEFFW